MVLGLKKARFLSSGFPLFRHVSRQLYRNASLPFPRRNLHCEFGGLGGDRGAVTAQPPTSIWSRRLKGIIAGCLVIRGGCWVGFAGHGGQFQPRDLTNFFKFGWARDPMSVGENSSPFWQVVTNTVFFSAEDLAPSGGRFELVNARENFDALHARNGEKIATFLKLDRTTSCPNRVHLILPLSGRVHGVPRWRCIWRDAASIPRS